MNTRQKSRERLIEMLKAMHKYGALKTEHLAEIVYNDITPSSAIRQTQKQIKRLKGLGLVIVKQANCYEQAHTALTERSARYLRTYHGLDARSGKDEEPSLHRDQCNAEVIRLSLEGYTTVYSEKEIQTYRAPFRTIDRKVPDGLGIDEDGLVTWLEVEASRRGGRDLVGLARWLTFTAFPEGREFLTFLDNKDRYALARVRFVLVVPPAHGLPQRLKTAVTKLVNDPDQWAMNRLEFLIPGQPIQIGFER